MPRNIFRTTLLACCCQLMSIVGWSQNQAKADSITHLIQTHQLDNTEKMEAYLQLSMFSSSPKDELKYALTLRRLAEQSNNLEYLIKSNQRIGVAYRLLGDLRTALEYLYQAATDAVGEEEHKAILANVYGEISTCYTLNEDFENALLYDSKTVEILRTMDKEQMLALTLLNVGYDHYLIENYDSALVYYSEAERKLRELDLTIGLAYILGNRSLITWKQGNTESAKKDLFTAIAMLERYGDTYGMSDYYNKLGSILREEGEQEMAMKYTLKGLEMARNDGLKEQARDASYVLFQLFQDNGDLKRAIHHQTQYYAYKDSIQNVETTLHIADLRTEFELTRKQAEIDGMMNNMRVWLILLAGVTLATFYFVFIFSKRNLGPLA